MTGYLGMFVTALVAVTIFPAQSEVVLARLIATETYSVAALVVIASIGNLLGSVVNWFLGRSVDLFKEKSWFPVGPASLSRAQGWYRTYGKWSLLASWLPVIGDPITLVAGVMKEPLPMFILLVGFAKTARYVAVAAATSGVI